jgi:hypothetical protein
MTPHDSEMNVLLRRYANLADDGKNTEHLDADELNAFAEGALPPAARSRYVSHLADCDDCRRAVTELAGASGRLEPMAVPASQPAAESWWQKIGAVWASSRLRNAAFAAILVAVAGIGYTLWRQSHQAPTVLTASNEQPREDAKSPSTSQAEAPIESKGFPQQSPAVAKTIPPPAPFVDQKQPESAAANPPPPPKPADALARNEAAPSAQASGGANVGSANSAAPSYAPPPPTEAERSDTRAREQQNLGLIHGPQRSESVEKNKSMDDRSRGAGDFAKARDEDRTSRQADQPVAKEEAKDEAGAARKRSAPRTATLAGRSNAGERQEEPKSDKAGPPVEADTRSVGGRKFKREGNAWVDVKLKSSMSIKTVSRGSEDFEKLDSGLRSIAQQLSGPIVVVWKGKAYRIQ